MRMYMTIPQLRRCLAKDEKFGEYDVPQESIVYVSVFMIKIKFRTASYFSKHYKIGKMALNIGDLMLSFIDTLACGH